MWISLMNNLASETYFHWMKELIERVVPPQYIGNKSGASEKLEFNGREEAIVSFGQARKRFFNVNSWTELSGKLLKTGFSLRDIHGDTLSRKPEKGDYIRIDIPGPGPNSGEGYDWVLVEAVIEEEDEQEDYQICAFITRPVASPKASSTEEAHFYEDSATSTFALIRQGNTVLSGEFGRNELPNTAHSEGIDKARNLLVSTGAMMGLAAVQWKVLMSSILKG